MRAIQWLFEHAELDGPATRWMLEAAAIVMRTETELILKSRRVVPTRLLESGLLFNFRRGRARLETSCAVDFHMHD